MAAMTTAKTTRKKTTSKAARKPAAGKRAPRAKAAGATRKSARQTPKRKFLVILDNSEEAGRALRFAGRRAQHTGGGLTLLYVVAPGDFQHWLNVESIMREEAMQEARQTLRRFAGEATQCCSVKAEQVIREGVLAEEIVKLIEDDKSIAVLVLAASTSSEGPGPLVSDLAGKGSGTFPIPITIVPGNLSDEEIDRLA